MIWLPPLILIPILTVIAVIFIPARHAKYVALAGSLVTFIWSVFGAAVFDWSAGGFDENLLVDIPWIDQFGLTLNMGVDSVSMLLILLSTFLMPLCVWGSFTAVRTRVREYYGWLLAIETAMVGVFLARDLIFFYICFEFTLIPMFFLIALYGGANRAAASIKFFLFTFTGSMLTLAGLLYIAWQYSETSGQWSFDIATLTEFSRSALSTKQQLWLLLALMSGFAVKVPLFPVHTWLPLAHTEAPTAGSVILAAVLLKLGTYGLFRFVLPMLPDGLLGEVSFLWWSFTPIKLIAVVSIIGILYAALICWVQTDVKKLIAYSSVSHLGFCVLGLFALNPLGAQGSVLYMLSHGLSTGALFFCIGMMYERFHTREMDEMSGLARIMPVWGFFMVFFTLASVGLPGLNGFVSEFLCLIGTFASTPDNTTYPGVFGPWYAAFAALGMIFAAMYLLIMLGKIVWGPLKEPKVDAHHQQDGDTFSLPRDLSLREIGVLTPIAILCLVLGFYPKPLTDSIEPSVEHALVAYPARIAELTRVVAAEEMDDQRWQGTPMLHVAEGTR